MTIIPKRMATAAGGMLKGLAVIAAAGIALWSCSGSGDRGTAADSAAADSAALWDVGRLPGDVGRLGSDDAEPASLADILDPPAAENPYDRHLPQMPDDGCVKLHINPVGGYLATVFNDSNNVHLEAAEALGIVPVTCDAEAWHLSRPLTRVVSNNRYVVDELTHSYPYLVPEAADLLMEIGNRFHDELQSRGGGSYRLKVTSLLRTDVTVQRLRRRNRNATEASAHRHGTTFDISYAKFICDAETVNRTQEDLKNLLAEILYELRAEGRCYVKYERRQGCFHITTRPTDG